MPDRKSVPGWKRTTAGLAPRIIQMEYRRSPNQVWTQQSICDYQRLALIDIGAGYARLAVGIDAFFEARIVELSLILKDRFERAMLPFCRQKAVAKREVHSGR